MQIAVTVPDDIVNEIDRLIPDVFRSRAEVVRVSLEQWLASRRRLEVDRAYLAGLADDRAEPVPHRLPAGGQEPASWADLPW